jgi:hypothetical protein
MVFNSQEAFMTGVTPQPTIYSLRPGVNTLVIHGKIKNIKINNRIENKESTDPIIRSKGKIEHAVAEAVLTLELIDVYFPLKSSYTKSKEITAHYVREEDLLYKKAGSAERETCIKRLTQEAKEWESIKERIFLLESQPDLTWRIRANAPVSEIENAKKHFKSLP